MTTPVYVAETGCTRSVNTLTLSGVAAADCMTFANAHDAAGMPVVDSQELTVSVLDPASGAHESWRATYKNAGGTLARVGLPTQSHGVIGTTGLTIAVIPYAMELAHIEGYILEWLAASGACVRANDGIVEINGATYHDIGSTTELSGDDVAGGLFSGSVSSLYHVFIYDDAGVRKLYFIRRDASAEDPVYDSAIGHWKAPSVDGDGNTITNPENYRLIGFFLTDDAGNCIKFYTAGGPGQTRSQTFYNVDLFALTGGTETTPTPVAFEGLAPANLTGIYVTAGAKHIEDNAGLGFGEDPGSPTIWQMSGTWVIGSPDSTRYLGINFFPITKRTSYYMVTTNSTGYVRYRGAEYKI